MVQVWKVIRFRTYHTHLSYKDYYPRHSSDNHHPFRHSDWRSWRGISNSNFFLTFHIRWTANFMSIPNSAKDLPPLLYIFITMALMHYISSYHLAIVISSLTWSSSFTFSHQSGLYTTARVIFLKYTSNSPLKNFLGLSTAKLLSMVLHVSQTNLNR